MNISIISGNMTADPEVKESSGNPFVRFCLAVSRGKDKETDFINCVAFGNTANAIGKYTKKGSGLVVNGRIQTGSYTNKEGQKVYTTDIIVGSVEFKGSKPSGDNAQTDSKSTPTGTEGFMNIPDNLEDEGLPFN